MRACHPIVGKGCKELSELYSGELYAIPGHCRLCQHFPVLEASS